MLTKFSPDFPKMQQLSRSFQGYADSWYFNISRYVDISIFQITSNFNFEQILICNPGLWARRLALWGSLEFLASGQSPGVPRRLLLAWLPRVCFPPGGRLLARGRMRAEPPASELDNRDSFVILAQGHRGNCKTVAGHLVAAPDVNDYWFFSIRSLLILSNMI